VIHCLGPLPSGPPRRRIGLPDRPHPLTRSAVIPSVKQTSAGQVERPQTGRLAETCADSGAGAARSLLVGDLIHLPMDWCGGRLDPRVRHASSPRLLEFPAPRSAPFGPWQPSSSAMCGGPPPPRSLARRIWQRRTLVQLLRVQAGFQPFLLLVAQFHAQRWEVLMPTIPHVLDLSQLPILSQH